MANDQESIIGQRIKARRKERDLTQAALAAAIGVDQSLVAKIENGKSVSEHTLATIAQALGTTPETFTADIDKPPMTEAERDQHCLDLACAASTDPFAQADLMLAMGCVAGGKPAGKIAAVDVVDSVRREYRLMADKIQPILELIKRGV